MNDITGFFAANVTVGPAGITVWKSVVRVTAFGILVWTDVVRGSCRLSNPKHSESGAVTSSRIVVAVLWACDLCM